MAAAALRVFVGWKMGGWIDMRGDQSICGYDMM